MLLFVAAGIWFSVAVLVSLLIGGIALLRDEPVT